MNLRRALLGALPATLLAANVVSAQQARLVEWVEDAPVTDSDRIALGYPVPLPVDTPLPFDGFRSYAGLHARHQDLALTSPWVHATLLGHTLLDREIWAYRLGDADLLRPGGTPEQAMLTNGGIHAREWQTPEVVTGIMELLVERQDDAYLYSYLRDNANIIVIPVLNVDGFLQTQRFPERNWLGTDDLSPSDSPRDGRMRRKNMRGADEDLLTQDDHLRGVDLNRNNPPFWNTSPGGSSSNPGSLVYHGAAPASEPETQLLDAAALLGPAGRLSLYTDVHSFAQVHFWVRNDNNRLASQTESVLRTFSQFHAAFPAGKLYTFSSAGNVARNAGIGTSDEYFTHAYQVPSWILEVEPSGGGNAHPGLPGGGADYGGLGRNGHDGFILPESQIRRVRSELAQTFAIAYYRQSAPPSISALRLTDAATGAVVYEAEWDAIGQTERSRYEFTAQPLQLERDYRVWIAFDKPMRWRQDGMDTLLPGQPAGSLDVARELTVSGTPLAATVSEPLWLGAPGGSPAGYHRYLEDAVAFDLRLPRNGANQALVTGTVTAELAFSAFDMTNLRTDADPATVARWEQGAWTGYEDDGGFDGTDSGGTDRTLAVPVTADIIGDPFIVEAGTASAWFDPARTGEGFVLEVLPGQRAVMYWFTYDEQGAQDWYLAVGGIRGNRILFPELLRVSGGVFGPGFDPEQVSEEAVGSADFIWSGCDSGAMQWRLDGPGAPRTGRMQLTRLSRLMGVDCGRASLPPEREEARLSGSWFDPAHAGEGFTVEVLIDDRALVYWFSYDTAGQRRWFFGVGSIDDGKLFFPDMLTTQGGVFGPGFDPGAVQELPWGALELDLGCAGGTASFSSTESGFPAGTLDLVRLTALQGLACPETGG